MPNIEINPEFLMTSVREMVLKACKDHEETVMKNLTEICDTVVKQILKLNSKIMFHNNDVKRRNVVLYGVAEDADETWEQIRNKVMIIMNNTMMMKVEENELDFCCRLGRRNYKYVGRPILIKFTTEWRKVDMLRRGKMLKGRKLFVDEDHTKEVMERRKELMPKMMQIRKEGKHAILKKDKIFVNGVEWQESEDKKEVESHVKETDVEPKESAQTRKQTESKNKIRGNHNTRKKGKK
uniref:Uncharacterized protein n=1 Tax=Cacopsylla melanoneura TaxID=428564 RepID=A0A8D8ZAF3_9HEMI